MNKPWLNKITYEFSQEGNTCGTTSEWEELTIEVDTPCGSIIDEDGFFVLRTTGWSIDDPSELTELLEHVINGVKIKKNEFKI